MPVVVPGPRCLGVANLATFGRPRRIHPPPSRRQRCFARRRRAIFVALPYPIRRRAVQLPMPLHPPLMNSVNHERAVRLPRIHLLLYVPRTERTTPYLHLPKRRGGDCNAFPTSLAFPSNINDSLQETLYNGINRWRRPVSVKVFVLNCGSSSVKYKLFDMGMTGTEAVLATGQIERVGTEDAFITHKQSGEVHQSTRPIFSHKDAVALALTMVAYGDKNSDADLSSVRAVGHRVVHGGELFRRSMSVTDEVMHSLRNLSELAPLHNPHNIAGIEACAQLLPEASQVAVFDTAFHANMPPHAYFYPLPYDVYERLRIRRYGFHGISHGYVAQRVAALMDKPLAELRII